MKKILFILILFTGAVQAQNTGGQINPTTKFQPFNKPLIASGQRSLDAKYKYTDTINFKERAFMSVAEAVSYIPSNQRTVGLTVLINTGGSLSNGTITGGTNQEYYWKDGISDGGLVVKQSAGGSSPTVSARLQGDGVTVPLDIKTATYNEVMSAMVFDAYGDSMTYGTGGVTTDQYPGGTPFMEHVKAATGFGFRNYGIPGERSDSIRARFLRDTASKNSPWVAWSGTNNLGSNTQILADIRAMKNFRGHDRFLIIDLLGQNNSAYYSGSGLNTLIHALNDSLEQQYPGHVVHIRQPLIAAYNPAIPADTMAHFRDVWPPSYGSDETHLNDAGLRFVAARVTAKMDSLLLKVAEGRALTTSEISRLFNYPGNIGRGAAAGASFTDLSVAGAPNEGDYLLDGQSFSRKVPFNVSGGASFLFPGSTAAKRNGIRIRPKYQDEGGFSTMVIQGTNPSVWGPLDGITVSNDQKLISMKNNLYIDGTFQLTGLANLTGLNVAGLSSAQFFSNSPYTSPIRVADFQNAGGAQSGGILVPRMTTAELAAIGIFGIKPGEVAYNTDLSRIVFAAPDPSITNAYKFEVPAFQSELTTVSPGPGINIVKSGVNYSISNTLFPPSLKLTGTASESAGSSNSNPASVPSKAIDGYDTTIYASNNLNTPSYWIFTLDSAKVLTQIRLRPAPGEDIAGAKLQGSNTSATAGFVDVFTVPANNFFTTTTYPINSSTGYKYYRIEQAPGSYRLTIAEIEFYGYTPVSAGDAYLAQTNNFTKSNTFRDSTYIKFAPPKTGLADSVLVKDLTTGLVSTQKVGGGNDTAYVAIGTTSDSSALLLYHANRSIKPDTFAIVGASGSVGGGGGSGSVTSVTSGNLSNLATVAVGTNTTTPVFAFSMIQPTAHTFFGNNTGSTTAPSYSTIDTTDIAAFAGKVRSVFSAGSNITIVNGQISAAGGGLTTVSSPLVLTGSNITINAASTSQAGALSSTDWNTFNGKAAASHTHVATDIASGFLPSGRFGTSTIPVTAINASGGSSTDFLRKDGTWAAPAGSSYTFSGPLVNTSGTVSLPLATTGTSGYLSFADWNTFNNKPSTAAVSAIVHDSLGTPTLFRNSQTAGADTLTSLSGNTIRVKTLAFSNSLGITFSKAVTDTSLVISAALTGTPTDGENVIPITSNYTVSLGNGYHQNIGFSGSTASQLITLSNTSTFDGTVLHIANDGSVNVATSVAWFRSDGTTGATIIPPGKWIRIVKRVGETKWWLTAHNL